MTELITVTGVSKSYDRIRAVEGASFTLRKGEILGFLGPNGAGKTTAMKMITGYMPADTGEIRVHGKNIVDDPIAARNAIGYLPENNPLYTDMTVEEYLTFVAEMRGVADPEAAKKRAMERCAIVDVRHRIIGHLSKGYRQRVGLAQAIIHDPEILILDEPANGLDPIQITEIRGLIRDLGREKSVILCSHILSEVEAVASRVIIINQGKIVADDTLENLKERSSGHNIFRIEFLTAKDERAVADTLAKIPGVAAVSRVANDTFRVKTKGERETGNQIFRTAVTQNWDLAQLHLESRSLENTFLSLIEGGNS
ncbi:MAG TPA: ATP-binding cassette domain-containing protein [bacterium]|nr:ATP-binding cassette domain-containing protein [bacterium]